MKYCESSFLNMDPITSSDLAPELRLSLTLSDSFGRLISNSFPDSYPRLGLGSDWRESSLSKNLQASIISRFLIPLIYAPYQRFSTFLSHVPQNSFYNLYFKISYIGS